MSSTQVGSVGNMQGSVDSFSAKAHSTVDKIMQFNADGQKVAYGIAIINAILAIVFLIVTIYFGNKRKDIENVMNTSSTAAPTTPPGPTAGDQVKTIIENSYMNLCASVIFFGGILSVASTVYLVFRHDSLDAAACVLAVSAAVMIYLIIRVSQTMVNVSKDLAVDYPNFVLQAVYEQEKLFTLAAAVSFSTAFMAYLGRKRTVDLNSNRVVASGVKNSPSGGHVNIGPLDRYMATALHGIH